MLKLFTSTKHTIKRSIEVVVDISECWKFCLIEIKSLGLLQESPSVLT